MSLIELLKNGGCKQVIFAITSYCNGKCSFCGFNQVNSFKRKNLELDEGLKAIEYLSSQGVKIISFTGGEPLLNPHLEKFIMKCRDNSIMCRTGTNGIQLDERKLEKLKKSGLSSMWFSIDSEEPNLHDKNRGKEGLFKHICKMREFGESIGIEIGAGVAISKLINNYDKLFKILDENGFKKVTFAYPSGLMNSSYLATTNDTISQFNQEELASNISKLIEYKEHSNSLKIGNSLTALKLMYQHLLFKQDLPKCYAGKKIFYLDWELQLYRCFTFNSYGNLFDYSLDNIENSDCNACYSQCFRDYSLYYPVIENQVLLNSFLAWHELLSENNVLGFIN